jgi:uncharacterized membrane protein
LSPASPPGGTAEWSGHHSPGDQSSWYTLPVGQNKLLLRVTEDRQNGLTAAINYDGKFTSGEVQEMRRQCKNFWVEIIDWIDTNAPDNEVANDARKWLSDARLKVQHAYDRQ